MSCWNCSRVDERDDESVYDANPGCVDPICPGCSGVDTVSEVEEVLHLQHILVDLNKGWSVGVLNFEKPDYGETYYTCYRCQWRGNDEAVVAATRQHHDQSPA